MAHNPNHKLTESTDRATSAVEANNRMLISQNRETVLRSSAFTQITAMALTGYEYTENPDTHELEQGEKLPLDLRERFLKLIVTKAMPNPKDVVEIEESGQINILREIQTQLSDAAKKNRHIDNAPVLEVDVDINVAGDVDF